MVDTRLITFLTLLEEKSYTKAAKKLYITQPAVTHHIKSLEKENGIALFKDSKTFELTPSGILLKEYAQITNYQYSQFRNALLKQEDKTVANIAVTPMLSFILKQLDYTDFIYKNRIGVNIYEYNYNQISSALLDGTIDFAVVDNSFDSSLFDSSTLFSMNLILTCSPNGQFKDRDRITREMLLNSTLVMGDEESGMHKCAYNALLQKNLRFKHNLVLTSNIVEWMVHQTLLYDGICFMYLEQAKKYIASGELKRIELLNFVASQNAYVLYNRTSFLDNSLMDFLDMMKKKKLE